MVIPNLNSRNLTKIVNVVHAGAAASGGSTGGTTGEDVVIGNGATPTPTVADISSVVNLSYSANAGTPATTPMSADASATPPPQDTTEPPAPEAPKNPTTEEAGTYYDYIKDDVHEQLRDIYNDEIAYQDQQNAQLVEDINGIRDTTIEGAGEIRDTAYENAETQKETTYTYADKVLMETLGFNEEQYKYLLDSINASKETGLALAEDVRATLLSLATETRDQIYQAAEAARVREYEQAEIVRQRGIVDASNSYEQNKATYGANAEALASMGLTGGGYSDYLNAQAYAAQRGEVQAVNADAEATKRAARYAEDDKKMNADATYAANVKEAELNYSEQVGEVNATYEAALRDANFWKAEADNAANREHTDTIFAADTTYNTAIGEADASYAENVADANLQADIAIAEANAATEAAKHEAEQKLKEDLLTNEQAIAEYREEVSQNIDYYISSGDFNNLQGYLEKVYNDGDGIIDKDTYQDAYFRAALQNCANASSAVEMLQVEADLKNLKDAGKISEADYNAAVKYMYASKGGLLNSSSYTVSDKKNILLYNLKITIDGKDYAARDFAEVNADISKVLTGIAGGETPKENTLCMHDGLLYIYREGWKVVDGSDSLNKRYSTLCSYQAKPTVPKHTAG